MMSFCARAAVAATRAVMPPIAATNRRLSGACTRSGYDLAVRYTPALTMVAACMRAETVVGPSIASGSHSWSGNCALLPIAPPNIRAVARIIISDGTAATPAPENSSAKSRLPTYLNRMMMPAMNMMSPTRVTMNALFAALAADGRSYQNPIRRYEHRPTSSQNMNIRR